MSNNGGFVGPVGSLGLQVIKAIPNHTLSLDEIKFHALPHRGLTEEVADWRSDNKNDFKRGFETVKKLNKYNLPGFYGGLWLKRIAEDGTITNYGLGSLRVVTDAGVAYIVSVFQGTGSLGNMKFHGIGTGTTAESSADTALITELTTQYNPDSTRATGTTTNNGANVYQTVATNTVDSGVSITEHGIFSQAATSGGTLLDRSKFTAVALSSGDSLQTTYQLTITSGG